MIADGVTFFLHLFDQIWIILQKIADDKKGSRNMMLFRAARIEGYCHFRNHSQKSDKSLSDQCFWHSRHYIFLIHRMRHFRRELFLPPENSTPSFRWLGEQRNEKKIQKCGWPESKLFHWRGKFGQSILRQKTEGKEEKED